MIVFAVSWWLEGMKPCARSNVPPPFPLQVSKAAFKAAAQSGASAPFSVSLQPSRRVVFSRDTSDRSTTMPFVLSSSVRTRPPFLGSSVSLCSWIYR